MPTVSTGKAQYVLSIPLGVTQSVLAGSNTPTRYVGATTSGPPAQNGKYSVGDFVIDLSGKIHICHTAGSDSSPGLWHTLTSNSKKIYGTTTTSAERTLTLDGTATATATNSVIIPVNTALITNITVVASNAGSSAALWKVSALFKRQSLASTSALVGLSNFEIVADPLFSETYVDIDTDTTLGSVKLKVMGILNTTIAWTAIIDVVGGI
jgi:hypothetical protein